MTASQEKLNAIAEELESVIAKHNEAIRTADACKERAVFLQGAAQALRELESEKTVVEAEPSSVEAE